MKDWKADEMDVETKLEIVKSDPTEEIITIDEMRELFQTNSKPIHYLGTEISGIPHIGHLFVGGKKINDFDSVGMKTNLFLADWHTIANNKLGGDWEKITKLSNFYKKLYKAFCPNLNVILGSELYYNNNEYWKKVLEIASKTTIARTTRTLIIEGRSEKDSLHVSQYMYPIMQATDIFSLNVDVPHAGMDQRRVHMLAKEIFKDMKLKKIIPVHHHLLPSMLKPPSIDQSMAKEEIVAAMKMSKSKAGSAIDVFATDEQIEDTMRKAWCPEKQTSENPVLELVKYVIMPNNSKLLIERKTEYGGDTEYVSYASIESDYAKGLIHPLDLKNACAKSLIKMFSRIRSVTQSEEKEVRMLLQQQ